MRVLLLLALLCLPAFAQKPAGKLTQTYDRFENATFVEWRAPLPVSFSDLSTPTLIIRFSYDGKTYQQPPTVLFALNTRAHDWRYLDAADRHAIILADGQRYDLGTLELLQARVQRYSDRTDETICTDLAVETFKAIAKAQSVEMRLGNRTFTFKPELVAGMRQVADLLK